MSRITVIGGHGKVARKLLPMLVEAGHEAVAVIRRPEHAEAVAELGATPLVADLEQLDMEGIAKLLVGDDVVVWSAGAGGGDPDRTYAVDRDAAIRSFEAANHAGARRYLMVSYLGAGPDHGVPEDHSFFPYAEAKAATDQALAQSGLDWTILMPTTLSDEPGAGMIAAGPGAPQGAAVSREDVARVIAACIERDDQIHRYVPFAAGGTPIDEALDEALREPQG